MVRRGVEWLAPAAIAGATVGDGTTWLVARGTREHAERMAFDARQHKRLEEAYIEMLQVRSTMPAKCSCEYGAGDDELAREGRTSAPCRGE